MAIGISLIEDSASTSEPVSSERQPDPAMITGLIALFIFSEIHSVA